jgi:hypothetical protein
MDIFRLRTPGLINHMSQQVGATEPVFPQLYRTIIKKHEFIIHNNVARPVQYSLHCLQCQAKDEWDPINNDNYFKNYFKTSEGGDVVHQIENPQHHNSLKRITFN